MIPLFAEMSIFSTKLTRKTANCVENNKYINIIIFRKLYVKMQQHPPSFPSILKFIIIHQPVRILSVLPKPFGNAEKRSFLS